jgi:hypothetical protein
MVLGAPGTSIGVKGPLAPLASRNPRAPAKKGSVAVGAAVYPTIWPRSLILVSWVAAAPGTSMVVNRPPGVAPEPVVDAVGGGELADDHPAVVDAERDGLHDRVRRVELGVAAPLQQEPRDRGAGAGAGVGPGAGGGAGGGARPGSCGAETPVGVGGAAVAVAVVSAVSSTAPATARRRPRPGCGRVMRAMGHLLRCGSVSPLFATKSQAVRSEDPARSSSARSSSVAMADGQRRRPGARARTASATPKLRHPVTLGVPDHPGRQPGQAQTAAGGGADRRSARRRGQAVASIARSARPETRPLHSPKGCSGACRIGAMARFNPTQPLVHPLAGWSWPPSCSGSRNESSAVLAMGRAVLTCSCL